MSAADKARSGTESKVGRPTAVPRCFAQMIAMIAIAPAWIAVALQNTNRKAGSGPYASRRASYWPPLRG